MNFPDPGAFKILFKIRNSWSSRCSSLQRGSIWAYPLRKTKQLATMLRTFLLLAMAFGVRRNEANGDCPGFKGDGVCEWGATRQPDGRGRVPNIPCSRQRALPGPLSRPPFCEQADATFRLDDANFVLKNGGLENFVTVPRPPEQQAQEGVRKMKGNCLSVCGPPLCASVQGCFSQDFKRNSKIEQKQKLHRPVPRASLQTKTPATAHPRKCDSGELPLLASAVENCCRNQH